MSEQLRRMFDEDGNIDPRPVGAQCGTCINQCCGPMIGENCQYTPHPDADCGDVYDTPVAKPWPESLCEWCPPKDMEYCMAIDDIQCYWERDPGMIPNGMIFMPQETKVTPKYVGPGPRCELHDECGYDVESNKAGKALTCSLECKLWKEVA